MIGFAVQLPERFVAGVAVGWFVAEIPPTGYMLSRCPTLGVDVSASLWLVLGATLHWHRSFAAGGS